MSDYKFPDDGTDTSTDPLVSDQTINIPQQRMLGGVNVVFEIYLTGVTSLDDNVTFSFYSAQSAVALDADNIETIIDDVCLTGLTGTLVFVRELTNVLQEFYRIIIVGTDPSSTAEMILRARSS